jgi:hypothetical protein
MGRFGAKAIASFTAKITGLLQDRLSNLTDELHLGHLDSGCFPEDEMTLHFA